LFHRASTGGHAATIAYERDGFIAKNEREEHRVDGVFQNGRYAMVIFRCDHEVRVGLFDLHVPTLHERRRIGRVREIADRS